MEKLTLVKKMAYAVWADLDERGPYVIHGIYENSSNAEKAKIGCGWYGGNGNVKPQEVYQDDNGLIYIVEKYGQGYFSDDKVGMVNAKLQEIKRKLSPEDLTLLKENINQI